MAIKNVNRYGSRDETRLKWEYDDYTPEVLRSGKFGEKEMRAEYTRLRDIAQKRLKRFEGGEWERSETYQQFKHDFGVAVPKLSQLDKKEFYSEFNALARFVSARRGSVSGLEKTRRETLRTLDERYGKRTKTGKVIPGSSGVTKANWWEYVDFMEQARMSQSAAGYSSDEVLDAFAIAREKGVDTSVLLQNFSKYMEYKNEMERNPMNADTVSGDDLTAYLTGAGYVDELL